MMSKARRSFLPPRAALLLTLASFLSACGSTIGKMPEALGGLPSDSPQRPAETMPFPNVYEPRPVREATPLTDAEQKKLESELATLRESQKQRANPPPPPPPAKKAAAAPARKPATKDPATKDPATKAEAPARKRQDSIVPEQKAPAPLKMVN
jgi:hypothetical protein